MAELPVGERQTAERDSYFKDSDNGKVYQRVQASLAPGEGIATEATQLQVKQNLDDIKSFTDDLENLLTAGNTLLDSIKTSSQNIEGFTDGLESLVTASNALLTAIGTNTDQLESYTDQIEALISVSNGLLDSIDQNTNQIEGFVDGIEGLVSATNALLTTIRDNADQVETLITATNTGISGLQTSLNNVTENNRIKSLVRFDQTYQVSPFGALRVTETQNVFESLFSFDKQPLIWSEQITGAATSVWNSNTHAVDMTLSTASGDEVIRRSFRRARYNPSRTVMIFASGVLGAPKTNTRKRIGQFDSQDGVFFEIDGTTTYVVRRSSTSGVAVDTKVAQASWNIDKFDGTGASGLTIDFSKHQLFFIQYAFQGFGDIVYGFYLNGAVHFCHRETIANVLTVPSMRTAHLPMRIEATNTGTTASPTIVSYNSFCIKNEARDNDIEGQVRSYSDAALKAIGTTTVPVFSIRLNSTYIRTIVELVQANLFVNTQDEVIWSLHLGATLTGATWAIQRGLVDIDTAATAQTGGDEVLSGYVTQNQNTATVIGELLKTVNSYFGSTIGDVATTITLSARARTGTADVLHSVIWREYP